MGSIYFFLALFSTLQISKATAPKKHIFFQIDEFIKQLMTSEKFDELTDLIADKAAQKIRNMDGKNEAKLRNVDKNEKIYTHSDEKDENIEKEVRSDEKSIYNQSKKTSKDLKTELLSNHFREKNHVKSDDDKVTFNQFSRDKTKDSRSREKSSYGHEKLRDKYPKSGEILERDHRKPETNTKKIENIGKIDTKTFLHNNMASKELELNFKHLKGELEKHRFDVKGNNAKTYKSYDKKRYEHETNRAIDKIEEINDKHKDLKVKDKLKTVDSKELLLTDGSDDDEVHEQATFHDPKNINLNSIENKSTNDLLKKAFTYDKHSKEKPIPRIKMFNNSEEFKSAEDVKSAKLLIDKVMNKVSIELNDPYSSKEVLVVGINRSRNEDPNPGKVHFYPGKSVGNMYPVEPRRRMEKDVELSTIQASSEYADYNESTAKSVSKFINTYK